MKRLLPLLIFLLVCSFAQTSSARMNAYIAGSVATVSGTTYTDCSNAGTSALYWNGDYTGDTDKACNTTATPLDGALGGSASVVASGTDPGTASPSSGANAVKLTAADDYIRWPITTKDIFDSDEGRISCDIYMSATTGTTNSITIYRDAENFLVIYVTTDGSLVADYTGNTVRTRTATTSTAKVPDTTWTNIQVRWSLANNSVGIKVGANDWENDADVDAVTQWASQPTYINIGGAHAQADDFYVDNFYVYKTSGL